MVALPAQLAGMRLPFAREMLPLLPAASEALAAWERTGDAAALAPARTLFHRVAGLAGLLGVSELGALAATGEDLIRLLQEQALGSGRPAVILRRHLALVERWARAQAALPDEPQVPPFTDEGPTSLPLPPRDDDEPADLSFLEPAPPPRAAPPPPPEEAEAEANVESHSQPHRGEERRRVLVVDDDPICAEILVRTLEPTGTQVFHYPDPLEALEAFDRTAPDVVLLDMDMPGQDGPRTCELLRAHAGDDRVPILMVTRSADVQDKVRALEAGADDYLTKPFEPAELRARVHAHALRYELQREQAFRDVLTGAWNRRYFQRRLAQWVGPPGELPFCVALLDLDHFKQVNDAHGHPAGDEVLVEAVRRVQSVLRGEDLVARLGGDELALLVRGASLPVGMEVLGRVVEAIRRTPFALRSGTQLRLTTSAGVAEARTAESAASLTSRADQALYASKHAGRDRASTG
ncbi:MAG: diguanylate cyclase [Deltaproteobacteria bacterium]|nr:diguanylate cyclase [Deltaproteobacteria bacterium]